MNQLTPYLFGSTCSRDYSSFFASANVAEQSLDFVAANNTTFVSPGSLAFQSTNVDCVAYPYLHEGTSANMHNPAPFARVPEFSLVDPQQPADWMGSHIMYKAAEIAKSLYFRLPSFSLPGASADDILCERYAETLVEAQREKAMQSLDFGSIVRINRDLNPVISQYKERIFGTKTFDFVQKIARQNRGIVGCLTSPSSLELESLMEVFMMHAINPYDQLIDIAFAIDTSKRMEEYMPVIKENLIKMMANWKNKEGLTVRFALWPYAHEGDPFHSKDERDRYDDDFTGNIRILTRVINELQCSEDENNIPRIPMHAIFQARQKLDWSEKAKRILFFFDNSRRQENESYLDFHERSTNPEGRSALLSAYGHYSRTIRTYPIFMGNPPQ
jgi:hypothetical protein